MFRLIFYILNLLLPSFLPTLIRYILLVWRLTFDKRVNLFVRALVPLALIYFVWPFDLVPDRFGPLSKFDDIIILGMAVLLLIKLSPKYVVAEHLGRTPPSENLEDKDSSKVVEGKARFPDQD
ncbi:MAG: YkvA family protein [Dehalococcoidia bacterium]